MVYAHLDVPRAPRDASLYYTKAHVVNNLDKHK